jgi:hypothetical protein
MLLYKLKKIRTDVIMDCDQDQLVDCMHRQIEYDPMLPMFDQKHDRIRFVRQVDVEMR